VRVDEARITEVGASTIRKPSAIEVSKSAAGSCCA
jgi:hypothetical protein